MIVVCGSKNANYQPIVINSSKTSPESGYLWLDGKDYNSQ